MVNILRNPGAGVEKPFQIGRGKGSCERFELLRFGRGTISLIRESNKGTSITKVVNTR